MSSHSKLDAIGRNQSAYMLETASDYLRAAKVIWLQPNLQSVAMVNAAIAIEIILKSFLSQPTNNMRKGTVGEQYEIKQKVHLFNDIAARIDRDIYDKLNFSRYCSFFEKNKALFVESRYPYEPSSRGGFNDEAIHVGIEIFNATMRWYKETGNEDPWVKAYPDVAGGPV
ncbi:MULTISPECIES: hypothetical protein [Aeromonas]|uniref:hypothetical protein n=1 Tax=Aeromonas TaxID=642 RepID=UPI0012FCF94D|nr:hypothetical protein [Aeromonas bivalvium]